LKLSIKDAANVIICEAGILAFRPPGRRCWEWS